MRLAHRHLAAAALLACSAALNAQQVLVVDDDGGPGVDFTGLPAALQAAADGDVLQLKAGTYPVSTLVIDGKGLVLAAEAGANVLLTGTKLTVQNLAPGQSFTMRGLSTQFIDWWLVDDAGSVWFEDVSFDVGNAPGPGTINAEDCENVVLTRCSVQGQTAINVFGDGVASEAVWATRSQLTIEECTLVGGSGDLSMTTLDVPGGDGIELHDSQLFLGGSSVTGGLGATAAGGAAVLLSEGSQAWLLDSVLTGGVGAPSGQLVKVISGFATQLTGLQYRCELESPKRVGETLDVVLQGPPGQPAWILKWLTPGGLIKPAWGGVLLVAPGFTVTAMGAIPPSGEISLTVTLPLLTGFEALPIYVQGAVTSAGGVRLTSASHLLLLDAGL